MGNDKVGVIGIDPGHCTGWATVVINRSPFSIDLNCAGTVPIYPEKYKAEMTRLFWGELLTKFLEVHDFNKIWIISEANVAARFASVFSITDQQLSVLLSKSEAERISADIFAFDYITTRAIPSYFGYRQCSRNREVVRNEVVDLYDLDRSALKKMPDAWDAIVVATAGAYKLFGNRREFMKYFRCDLCGTLTKFVDRWRICACGVVSGVQLDAMKVKLRILDSKSKKAITVVEVSRDGRDIKEIGLDDTNVSVEVLRKRKIEKKEQ